MLQKVMFIASFRGATSRSASFLKPFPQPSVRQEKVLFKTIDIDLTSAMTQSGWSSRSCSGISEKLTCSCGIQSSRPRARRRALMHRSSPIALVVGV